MTKAILFDIDGTLTETISGKTFKQNPTDIKAIEGIKRGLEYFSKLRYTLIGISNQGEVAAGHKSIDSAIEEMQNTLKLLPLECIYICPDFEGNEVYAINYTDYRHQLRNKLYHPNAKNTLLFDSFRKPNPGMIAKAIWDFNLHDALDMWYIGDRPEDESAAAAAGVNFLWAEVFHKRFTTGIQILKNLTPKQIEFLEGVKI